ncbi:unnamed protein product [Phyllotreta striolata]|uniref:Protein PTHB1 n=1 Tax=Phyllotreta striolata TaxID=444603 RepID=A0A9N9TEM0_PHYSR|nr:unnamed protein product [Phyllotreta striolata]
MSLFKTRGFWQTGCEQQEDFDQNSMIVTPLNGNDDYVITGSQAGVLRIFKPNCGVSEDGGVGGFSPEDLIVEIAFREPILQIGCGRLVSGSLVYQTAVLNPRCLSVHLLKIKEGGAAGYSSQNTFEQIYEHRLERSAANFTIGQFGGVRNRDFICVQTLDGTLEFFEQENRTFSCSLSNFLLPGPLVFVKKTDSFVTVDGNWSVVSYKYNALSEGGDESNVENCKYKKINPTWTYNLGENVLDIAVVEDAVNNLNYIVILGERNLFCLFDTGRLKFMKKLEYSPMCFETYVICERVYSLVVSDTSNLLVYENTTLKWSAKLNFLPISVRRTFLKNVKGALAFLSEEGRLECCYLGTQPNLFVAPPLVERELDLLKVEEELSTLNKTIRETYGNELHMTEKTADKEMTIKIQVDPNLEPCTFPSNVANVQMCTVYVEIVPHLAFDELQVSIDAAKPLKVHPSGQFFNGCEEVIKLKSFVFLEEDANVPSLSLIVVVTAISSAGVPKSFNDVALLPLRLVMEICSAQKEAKHKVTLNVDPNVVSLTDLFPEYAEDNKITNAIAFEPISSSTEPVTILLAKSSNRYRIQTSCFSLLSVIVEQMIHRLEKYYKNLDGFGVFYNAALPSNEIVVYVKEHFEKRNRVCYLENALDKLCAQFRTIQKRLISKFKVKEPTPLLNLEILMKDTYKETLKATESLRKANDELLKAQIELTCALKLTGQLIKLTKIEDGLKNTLVSAFCATVEDLESQNWEDTMDAVLSHLLRTTLAKNEKDKLRISQTQIEKVTDISKMERHLVQVLERVMKIENTSTNRTEEGIAEVIQETTMESELDKEEEKLLGSQFGESSLRLLSARKSLNRRHQKTEQSEEPKSTN